MKPPSDPAAKVAPSDNPAKLIGALNWFERIRAPIDLELAIAGMSGPDLITLDGQLMRAQGWFGQIEMIRAGQPQAVVAPGKSPP
jgi:hypothetical protein